MNAFVRKEIRLLLPNWTVGLLAALSVWLIPLEHSASGLRIALEVITVLFCPALVVMMALDSFGGELAAGTFSSLLAQPMPRARIWRTKTLVLALGVALVYAAWGLSVVKHFGGVPGHEPSEIRDALVAAGLFALVACSGGLWTVLLFRQLAVAFWLTLLIPAGLLTLIEIVQPTRLACPINSVRIAALLAYSAAGFLWARWMFLRAQDTPWTGGTIALPQWNFGWPGSTAKRPRMALLAKEVQLHQSQLLLAGLLAMLHLGVMALRRFGGDLHKYLLLEFMVDQFWMLWLVMPLLVGSAAVAEERKLGTLEGLLGLPLKRRTLFAIKFGAVLLLSILLGAVMPLLLEGHRILPDSHFNVSSLMDGGTWHIPENLRGQTILVLLLDVLRLVSAWMPFLILAAISAGVATLSFYASTLTRNPLQALGPAVLIISAAATLLSLATAPERVFAWPLWRGPLVYLIGLPLLAATLAGLMYWNFKHLLVGWAVWRRNLLWLLGCLVFVTAVTTAIYQRAWELLLSPAPPHGSARLARAKSVTLHSSYYKLALHLPDGRVWLGYFAMARPSWSQVVSGDWTLVETPGRSRFLDGSNWVSVALCHPQEVAIRADGSLWVSELPAKSHLLAWANLDLPASAPTMVRFGDQSDWRSAVSSYGDMVFLLKNNGNLWRWATNRVNWRQPWPGLLAFQPERIGNDSDWVDPYCAQGRAWFRKADGRTWAFPEYNTKSEQDRIQVDAKAFMQRVWTSRQTPRRSFNWSPVRGVGLCQVGICEDGTLHVAAPYPYVSTGHSRPWERSEKGVQLGRETNWLAASADVEGVAALKADGSLWRWTFPEDPVARPDTARLVRLGTQSDWLAVASLMRGVLSLAEDGSLWFWRFEPHYYSGSLGHPLLYTCA